MSRQLAVQAGTQAPKRMGEILFNSEMPRQLPVDRLDQLANGIVKLLIGWRDLLFLVRSRESAQGDPMFLPQFFGFGGTDVSFVSKHFQIGVLLKQLTSSLQVTTLGGRQFKI